MVKRRRRGTLRQRRAHLRSSEFRGQGPGPVARDFLQRHFQTLPAGSTGEIRGKFRLRSRDAGIMPRILLGIPQQGGKCSNYFPGRRHESGRFCFARVHELYKRGAFLAVLAFVAECRISKLQIIRIAWGFKSPSPHQSIQSKSSLQNRFVPVASGCSDIPSRSSSVRSAVLSSICPVKRASAERNRCAGWDSIGMRCNELPALRNVPLGT